jgi:hypothetical protein
MSFFQGLSNGTTLMQIQSGRTVPLYVTVGEAAATKFKLCSYIFGFHKHRPLVFIIFIPLLSFIDPLDIYEYLWEELDQSSLRQFSRHLLAWDRTLAACRRALYQRASWPD